MKSNYIWRNRFSCKLEKLYKAFGRKRCLDKGLCSVPLVFKALFPQTGLEEKTHE